MSVADRMHFGMMSFVHETLYSLFRDPYRALRDAGLRPGQQVLEVGCGPGFFTVPAAKIVGASGGVHALDINPWAVRHVREKVEGAGVTNVEVLLADAAHTGLPDQSFDLAFLFGFHPIGDLGGIMAELHRLLKPGGTLSVEGRLLPPSDLFQTVKRGGRTTRFRRV